MQVQPSRKESMKTNRIKKPVIPKAKPVDNEADFQRLAENAWDGEGFADPPL
jgi:hypothetical protein